MFIYGDQPYEAAQAFLRTSAEAERMGAPRSLALCHYIGATAYFRGRFPEAQTHLVDALALYQQVDAPAGQAVALQFLGMTVTALGRLEEGRQHLERGVVGARRSTLWSHTLIRLYAALGRNRRRSRLVLEIERGQPGPVRGVQQRPVVGYLLELIEGDPHPV